MEEAWLEKSFAKQYSEKVRDPQENWYEEEITFPKMMKLMPAPNKNVSVLDYGCGSGEFTKILSEFYPDVVGADVSAAMVELAREAAPEMEFLVWDYREKYPKNRKFDVIFSKLVLHFIEDLDEFARVLYGLLKPGGVIVLATTHPLYSKREAGKYFETSKYQFDVHGNKGLAVFLHRSFEGHIEPFLRNGLVLSGISEPAIPKEITKKYGVRRVKMTTPKRLILRFERKK